VCSSDLIERFGARCIKFIDTNGIKMAGDRLFEMGSAGIPGPLDAAGSNAQRIVGEVCAGDRKSVV